jgi:hypothetical protein
MGCGSSAPLVLGGLPNDEQDGGALVDGILGRNEDQATKLVQSHALKVVYVQNNKETISFKMDGNLVAKLAIESGIEGFVVRNAGGKIAALMRAGSEQTVTESPWGSGGQRKFVKGIATVYSAAPRREGQEDALSVEGVPLYEWATITHRPKSLHGIGPFASVVQPHGIRWSQTTPQMVVHMMPHSVGARVTRGQGSELIGKCAVLNIKVGAGVDPLLIALAMLDFERYGTLHLTDIGVAF